ncbi:MAG: hypothetical protein EA378_10535 [Phycisphaerales bacterium]|nr:MAG: hypothetical protein EA378_10535 [Phycisphaerales bacterium]
MRTIAILVAGAALAAAPAAFADLEDDFAIGFTGSTGNLAVEFNFDEIAPLSFVSTAGFTGWISDDPGFANIVEDEADEDFFALAGPSSLGQANIAIRIVSVDPGFRVVDPLGFNPISGEPVGYVNPGEFFTLGVPNFDDHPFWTVDVNDWDGSTLEFGVSFQVIDLNEVYGDSEVYSAVFAIPSPGTSGLIALAGLVATRRRRF